ncbi:hypothetical protein SAMN05444278_1182 [Psychroflexus salarius]|uniref:PGAP1-like protein n=1 Tax=Psychroflexus salarius TaxID=1155689 RepID=A0A1M4Y9H7_9FLAO|nr:hypothetical protein [Psychroflexus salarius]SHF02269.1 hypothetical protein SAMN05444278_1182 [Psychroflexus salarius]
MKKSTLNLSFLNKTVYLLIMTFVFHFGYSQNVNTSLASDINQKFSLLEKNRIPNHILLDYGFDLIDVTQFDGALRNDNYLDLERYNLIYNSIVSSATQLNVSGIKSPQQELEKWKTLQKEQSKKGNLNNKASVTLSGLLFNYSKINENALYANKISVVNDKYDDKYINGIWQNPYDNKTAFAVVSPVFAFNKSNIEVKLPTELWHSNVNISAIAINFGDGAGYKNLTNNTVASTNYTTTGVYTWTYRVRLTNGQYKYCRQKIKVTQIDSNSNLQALNSSCSMQYKSITASKDYQGIFGSATLQIAYGSNNCTMQKPLIVVEGLDTGIMGQGGSIGDSDIGRFFQYVDQSASTDLQNLITNNTTIDYDIVYVNWDNGTDYIQRNAYVLEDVIKWVNERKAEAGSTEPNVVLGQSMGGLVARYALKDMENDTDLDHDTSLYISHDAPHQGAHIPLGILHMGRHVVNEFIQTPLGNVSIPINGTGSYGLATIDDLLDAPAVNQMLINNVDTNGNRTNATHLAWQSELQNMGYPQQTRNISLSNASHCGNGQGLASNEELVTVTGKGGTSVLTSIIESLFINIDPVVGIALDDVSAALLGFLPGNSELDIEFRANAFPASGTARIYKGRLTYEKKFLWLIPITRTIFNTSKHSQNGDKFIDNYPGGITPNGLAISESGDDNNWFYNYDYNINVNLSFDFIPVTSALDVGSGNATLDNTDYFRQYTSANPPTGDRAIPFVNFTTSSNQNNNLNAEHISFNRRNGDWLAEELDADANIDLFDCTFTCSDVNLFIPDDIVCSTTAYFFDDDINISNINITQGSNLVSLFGVNSNTLTISPNSLFGGGGLLAFNFTIGNNKCGSQTFYKTIWVGKPKNDLSLISSGGFTISLGNFYQITAMHDNNSNYTQANLSYEWEIPYAMIMFSNNNRSANIRPTRLGTYPYKVRARNLCGCSQWATQHFEVLSAPGPGDYYISPANQFGN